MICRSLVCCRLELHQNRTATTLKLKAEFDRRGAENKPFSVAHRRPYVQGEPLLSRRLDKNGVTVDVLNTNREIWFAAGGPDIESLASPTEPMIDHCKRTVTVLQAMVEKHGAQGGLDSHVEDITTAVQGQNLHILVQQHARSFVCLPFPCAR